MAYPEILDGFLRRRGRGGDGKSFAYFQYCRRCGLPQQLGDHRPCVECQSEEFWIQRSPLPKTPLPIPKQT